MSTTPASAAERFEDKYIPEPNSGCWIWIGAVDERGYARMFYEGRNAKASHVSWFLNNATPIGGNYLCHRCDNPCCVNPNHLFLGTGKDNAMDMAKKGRIPHAKLRPSDIPTILERHRAGEAIRAIARDYSVSEKAIRQIFAGEAWSHVR